MSNRNVPVFNFLFILANNDSFRGRSHRNLHLLHGHPRGRSVGKQESEGRFRGRDDAGREEFGLRRRDSHLDRWVVSPRVDRSGH